MKVLEVNAVYGHGSTGTIVRDIEQMCLDNGKVAVLNRCDFVYVQYHQSSFIAVSEEDRRILFQPGILRIKIIPS